MYMTVSTPRSALYILYLAGSILRQECKRTSCDVRLVAKYMPVPAATREHATLQPLFRAEAHREQLRSEAGST